MSESAEPYARFDDAIQGDGTAYYAVARPTIWNWPIRALRQVVSGDKKRYVNENIDFDFSYITDRVVAMAFPGAGLESLWRNRIQDVAAFLNYEYGSNYRILNLSEREYDYSLFNNQVINIGFPDHHNPPVYFMFYTCRMIHSWLLADPRNIVIVHCLAGRGRTGTIIAAYLVYMGMFDNGTDALDFFAQQRSYIQKGVTQPSQRRYVQYFSEILHGRDPIPKTVLLEEIILYVVPKGFSRSNEVFPYIEIFRYEEDSSVRQILLNPTELLQTERENAQRNSEDSRRSSAVEGVSIDHHISEGETSVPILCPTAVSRHLVGVACASRTYRPKDGCVVLSFSPPLALQGDIYIRCYHLHSPTRPTGDRVPASLPVSSLPFSAATKYGETSYTWRADDTERGSMNVNGLRKSTKVGTYMLRVGFHTGFVNSETLRFTRAEIDDACKKRNFDEDFFMDIKFAPNPNDSLNDSHSHGQQSYATTPDPRHNFSTCPSSLQGASIDNDYSPGVLSGMTMAHASVPAQSFLADQSSGHHHNESFLQSAEGTRRAQGAPSGSSARGQLQDPEDHEGIFGGGSLRRQREMHVLFGKSVP